MQCRAHPSLATPFQRWDGVFVFSIKFEIGDDMEQDDPLGREGGDELRARSGGGGVDPVDWEAIKHAYIYGDKSIDRIAAEFGSSNTTITRRAKAGGWVRLVGTRPLKSGRKPRPPGVPRPTPDEARRRKMVRRLFEVLDGKLREIEERMAEAEREGAAPQSAADNERDARSLTALARLYAKLVELDEAAKTVGEGSDKSAAARSDDADQLRRDLALRLERLNRARDA